MAKKKTRASRNATTRSAKKKRGAAKTPAAQQGPLAAVHKLVERSQREDGQDLSGAQKRSLLRDCEALINKHVEGFFAVGIALRIVRDGKLYEQLGYKNFEAYCDDRFGFKRARASQLIAAADVTETVYNCKQITRGPTNEAQVRPLVNLDPKQQIAVWKKVVKKAGNDKRITAKLVEEEAAKVASKRESNNDKPDAVQEETPADRRKRIAAHCGLLKKLDGERPSRKVKALKGALDVHAPKFLDEVVDLARRRGTKLSHEGSRRASGVTGDEIMVGLVQKLMETLADTDILDLLAPVDNDEA